MPLSDFGPSHTVRTRTPADLDVGYAPAVMCFDAFPDGDFGPWSLLSGLSEFGDRTDSSAMTVPNIRKTRTTATLYFFCPKNVLMLPMDIPM